MTESFQWDATLALLRWQRTRHGNSKDAMLLQTGFSLLQPDIDAKFGPNSVLHRAERAFNLPWQRMASEVLQFAVFLLTRTKQNDVKQTQQALRLLQLSINVFAIQGDAHLTSLTLNMCNLLLSALADMVEKVQPNEETLQTIQDVKAVFCFLFGLSNRNVAASFHMYRPPTNVYAEFFKRALRALLQALQDLQNSDRSAQTMQQQQLYVELLHAVLFVFKELQKTQTNKKKGFLAVAKTLLQYFVAYRHTLVTLQKQGIAGVKAVILLLDQIVEDALFDTEHICQYDSAMVHCAIWKTEKDKKDEALGEKDEKEIKKRRAASGSKMSSGLLSYQKKLFDELLNLLLDKDVQQELKVSVGGFFEMLVRGFSNRIRAAADTKIEDTKTDLKTSRKRAAIVIATTSTTYSPFKFWSELCAVAYLAFQNNTLKKNFLPVLVTLYNALFRVLCDCDVYRMTEDTEERKQFHTMENVLLSFLNVLNDEHCDEIIDCAARASEECDIVSNAVRCSPNLVNTCLVSILELFGLQSSRLLSAKENNNTKHYVAVTTAVVELIRAFFSMRLIDIFLNSIFSIQRAHEGLYMLLKQPPCDSALRKAFAALPPGQVDVLWKLFVKQIASFAPYDGNSQDARGVIVARLLFQMFVQEFHVVPQTRLTLSRLVSDTHQKLFSKLVEELDVVASPFTLYQRELFCIFGELVMFDDVVDASVREQTFGRMLDKLQGDRFFRLMAKLLSNDLPIANQKRRGFEAKPFDVEASSISTSDGLSATGSVKLCVFWLRKSKASRNMASCDAQVARDGREQVTRLVVEYVSRWKCWETVSFHLPELMASAGDDECDFFFRNIVKTYISEASVNELDMSARHIICDAGFYEIASLQKSAPTSLTSFVQQFVDEAQNALMTGIKGPLYFFKFLLKLPERYLKPEDCGNLLIAVLSFYKAISMTTCNSLSSESELCQTLVTWIQLHFKIIGKGIYRSLPALIGQLHSGCRYIFSQLAVDDAVNVSLISEVLGCYSDMGADVQIAELLNSVLVNSLEAEEPPAMTRKLKRAAIVVEALVAYRGTDVSDVSVGTTKFVEEFVKLVNQEKLCEMESPLSFIVVTALVKYQSFLHKRICSRKHQSLALHENRVLPLHVKNIERALSASMKLIVTSNDSTDIIELQTAAWSFFANFCEEYSSFRALVSPLKTFGCLVAVSLSLVSQNYCELKMEQALQAIVANANTDECCLLLSTIVQELAVHDYRRKLSALRAMYLLLNCNRRINASRRRLLNAHKHSIVQALLQNFTLQSLHFNAPASGSSVDAKTLGIWNIWSLKSFVLVFCKPELFTWKTQEFQHIFTGFQPLVAAASCWQAGSNSYAAHELHELWTLSYTLLLRIVRHHFSLVNNVPHLVRATNTLLQLLVLASPNSEYSKYCSDWSSNLARLFGYMKERDVQLRKHVVYLLMAFLLSVSRDKLPVRYQLKLRPGVFALLDVCSPYEKEQLFGALDSTGKSLLKTLDNNYKLTHRYVGKV